ncbi:MAG: helix-turn-helix domain-containing protein [Streptococcus orisratti]|jgi:transcriptional regulator with XRE-family HTH domain|uniref:helix-turn-helix domain-containing protein n=1 Tax=Bacillota TaxID=1239 RepID=UPI00048600A0|nr:MULTISPECIES: helix-turn-helix transcriptional regulator [Bacillota]MCI7678571.1 helix-turn-helix domain-containing protein [Streptococcus orisratti]
MAKILSKDGQKNLIGSQLVELRKHFSLSQRDLAHKLQLAGYNLDKNVITRIENYQRFVTDIELKGICEVLKVSSDVLIDIQNKSNQ